MTEKEIDAVYDEYVRKFGRRPPVGNCIGHALQAAWWKECIRRNDPMKPWEEAYDAYDRSLPKGALI